MRAVEQDFQRASVRQQVNRVWIATLEFDLGTAASRPHMWHETGDYRVCRGCTMLMLLVEDLVYVERLPSKLATRI
jgi:hypothetical protein